MVIIEDESEEKEKEGKKTLIQKAENFAKWVASLVDGGAPVIGAALPLIPFMIGINLTIFHFIFSYIILVCLLIYLGIFLGNISGGSNSNMLFTYY